MFSMGKATKKRKTSCFHQSERIKKMKKLVIANQKGGVGKTTLTLHIAQYAASQGLRVLLVDFDNQGSLSLYFRAISGLVASSLFVVSGGDERPFAVSDNLHIVRADAALLSVDKGSNDLIKLPKLTLKRFDDDYDICIMDTAGALGVRMTSALTAADFVITPVNVGLFEMAAIADLFATIQQVKMSGFNPRLKHAGIIPMKTNARSKDEMAGLETLRSHYGQIISACSLTERAAVKKAVAGRLPVWERVRGVSHKKAATEWLEVCNQIVKVVMG
jgi:chromosome partitioning protein